MDTQVWVALAAGGTGCQSAYRDQSGASRGEHRIPRRTVDAGTAHGSDEATGTVVLVGDHVQASPS
jgi:hypothetical protein